MAMSKRLIGDLGQAMYRASCQHDCDDVSYVRLVNAVVGVLDNNGEDFRLFLQAAGASDEEQALGRMKF